jgi:hypothetical protein
VRRELALVVLWSLKPPAVLSLPAISWPSFACVQPSALWHRLSSLIFCFTSFFKSDVLGFAVYAGCCNGLRVGNKANMDAIDNAIMTAIVKRLKKLFIANV